MPTFLRILTAMSLMSVLFVIGTIFSGEVTVGHTKIGVEQWWLNGSGIVLLSAMALFFTSGIAILRRSRHARALFLIGWVALYLAAFVIGALNKIWYPWTVYVWDALFGVVQFIVFFIYFYFSKSVRDYFVSAPAPSSQAS